MLRFVVILAVVAAAAAHPRCPQLPAKTPFDLNKFQGDWLLAAGNDVTIAVKGKCGKITFPAYTKEDGKDTVLNSRYTGVSIKDNATIAFDAFFLPAVSDNIGLLYGVFRAEGTSVFTPVTQQSIVATDYSTYALLAACKPTFDAETKTFGRKLFAEIWTRKDVNLSKEIMDTLTTTLASYDVEPETIHTVDQNC